MGKGIFKNLVLVMAFFFLAPISGCEEIEQGTEYYIIFREGTDIVFSISARFYINGEGRDVLFEPPNDSNGSPKFPFTYEGNIEFKLHVSDYPDNWYYSGVISSTSFIQNKLNEISIVSSGSEFKVLLNGTDQNLSFCIDNSSGTHTSCTGSPLPSTGTATGGGTACLVGTWYSPACGDPKGVKWTFGAIDTSTGLGRGSFSNKDCNGICTPMVFTFNYKKGSGTTYNILYDATQPIVQCTGFEDSRPPKPNDATVDLTCSGSELTVKSGNGTAIFTK